MFHEDILYRKYIKTFLISNMHCQELYLGNFINDLDLFCTLRFQIFK